MLNVMYPLLPTYIHAENLEVCKNWCQFATLGGAHAQRGLQYLVCLSGRRSVTTFSATTRDKQVK